jgi:hypothetical protein
MLSLAASDVLVLETTITAQASAAKVCGQGTIVPRSWPGCKTCLYNMLRKDGQTNEKQVFFRRRAATLLHVSANRLADLLGCSQRILGNTINQPQLQRILCVDFLGCDEHVKSLCFSDEA